jgi:hypothetical protein
MDELPPPLPVGALRAIPILPGLARMERPDTPRLVERWDGRRWRFHAIAPDMRTAYDGMWVPPPSGAGRHRRR